MASLTLTYADFMNAVGNYLGFGTDYTAYTSDRSTRCDAIVQSGLRKFYYPEISPSEFEGWSFLAPTVGAISLVANTSDYDLPTDFGSIDGPMTYGAGLGFPPIYVISENDIRQMRMQSNAYGEPQYVAVRPKSSTGSADQLWEALFWPTPAAARVVTYKYSIAPPKLTAALPYPLGNVVHSETIKSACLSVAELEDDDQPGIHTAEFQKRLMASIQYDQQAQTQDYFGYNADTSASNGLW